MEQNVLIGLCIGLSLMCIGTTIVSIVCVGIIVGFKNSTHQIEYRDVNWQDEDEEDEKPFNPFANSKENVEAKIEDPVEFKEKKKQWLKTQRELEEGLIGSEEESMLK